MASTISMSGIRRIIEKLRNLRHRGSTQRNYYTVWKIFNRFYIKLDVKPSNWEERIQLFVGQMIEEKKQSSTNKSYLSAIRAVLKNKNIKLDEDLFLINSLTRVCRLQNDQISTRLPIRRGMLGIILNKVDKLYSGLNQLFLATLYRAIISAGYFGLMRIGELTYSSNVIAGKDVQVAMNKNKFMFILRSSKTHGPDSKPQLIKITSKDIALKKKDQAVMWKDFDFSIPCPYSLLRNYINIRGPYKTDMEQSFIFRDGSPVHPRHITKCLRSMITLDSSLYSFYSLRIGRLTDLLRLGLMVESMKKLG